MKILWANFRFWWTNKLMIYYVGNGNFSKVEELLPIRKKLVEFLRVEIQNKRKINQEKDKNRKEWLQKPELSWKIVYMLF